MTNRNINVLLVEDDPDDVYLVKQVLAKDFKTKYSIEQCSTLRAVPSKLKTGDIDIILLDLGLEDSQGIESLTRLKQLNGHVPCIVMTGIDSDEVGEKAIQQGAEDYVPKTHVTSILLTRAIKYSIERDRLHKELKRQASEDPLTKLPNRTVFFERLKALIHQSERKFFNIALVMIDLDDFKPINDKFGHQAGDRLLQELALRLKTLVRTTDGIARYGGDEFAMLLTNFKDEEQLEEILKQKQEILQQPYSIQLNSGEKSINVGISMGAAVWETNLSIDDLTFHSDKALYKSKAQGKNQLVIYDH